MKKKAYVETYGCQMNISDGELMEGVLETQGYEIVDRPEAADVVLVNTCAIREHAETRVLGRVSQLNGLKADRPELVIGVTGCMAQRMGQALLEQAPYVDLVVGPDGYRDLADQLESVEMRRSRQTKRSNRQLAVLSLDPAENYAGLEQRRTSSVSAWVPIQRGCDHRCTYCIVPYVRGPEKNRLPEDVVAEVRGIAEAGITEVTLLGQTVNSYTYGEWSFSRLLRAVARVPGISRVRFTSPHPNDVNSELVQTMMEEPAVCEHIHLPAQSGNDRTLKRMVRRYTLATYLQKVEMLRDAIPNIAISTDIIVGFPGETDEEFRDTLALMRTVGFDEAYTYKYSLRDGTPATRFADGDFIADAVAQARLEELIEVSRSIAARIARRELGRTEEVLVERKAKLDGQVLGRTRRNKMVAFQGDPSWVGSYRSVFLDDTTGMTFIGRCATTPAVAVVS